MQTIIFDNGGVSFDRYTLINKDGDVFGCSDNPSHPQGFGQFCGNIKDWSKQSVNEYIKETIEDEYFGVLVKFKNLSKDVQKFIKERE